MKRTLSSNIEDKKQNKISCSIVGARGYSGLELARILLRHPQVELKYCFATSSFQLSSFLSNTAAKNVTCLPDSEIFNHLTDIVFLATPAEVSLKLAPQILAHGKKIIDLSGAFRLKKHSYEKWYGFDHTEKEILAQAQYGLVPWIGPASQQQLIANPGCYATAISAALIPLIKNHLIKTDSIVIDAKSGTTGAGKKAAENLLFTEVDGECLPYKVGKHQHYPEIVEAIEIFSGEKIEAHMTTSLLSARRGIIAGIYAQLKRGVTIEDIEQAFTKAYLDYSLVEFGSVKEKSHLLSLKKVVGTGKINISYEVVDGKLYLFSCIDNLLKGAASQAVENMNRISDLPLNTGVSGLEAIT